MHGNNIHSGITLLILVENNIYSFLWVFLKASQSKQLTLSVNMLIKALNIYLFILVGERKSDKKNLRQTPC